MRLKAISIALYSILILGFIAQVSTCFRENLPENNLSGFYISRDIGTHLLDSLDYGAKLITRFSNPHFLIFYLQEVEGYRPDTYALSTDTFVDDKALKVYVSRGLKKGIPIYWVGSDKTEIFYRQVIPHGVVFRFMNWPISLMQEDLDEHLRSRMLWEGRLYQDRYQDEYETYFELFRINSELHRYYYGLKQRTDLEEMELRALVEANPTSPFLNLFYSISLFIMGKADESSAALLRCQERLETLHGRLYLRERRFLFYNAGVLSLNGKNYALAEYFLKEAMKIDTTDENIRFYLAKTLFGQGKLQEARKYCLTAIEFKPKEDNKRLLQYIEEAISKQDKSGSCN